MDTGARLITGRDWHGPRDWVDLLLAPLVVGGSIVLVRNGSDLERRRLQERATRPFDGSRAIAGSSLGATAESSSHVVRLAAE